MAMELMPEEQQLLMMAGLFIVQELQQSIIHRHLPVINLHMMEVL